MEASKEGRSIQPFHLYFINRHGGVEKLKTTIFFYAEIASFQSREKRRDFSKYLHFEAIFVVLDTSSPLCARVCLPVRQNLGISIYIYKMSDIVQLSYSSAK